MQSLEQAFVELRILVGAVQDPGPRENLPPGVELSGLGRFNGAEPSNPVGDLLFPFFESSDPFITFFFNECLVHSVMIVAQANLYERMSEESMKIFKSV